MKINQISAQNTVSKNLYSQQQQIKPSFNATVNGHYYADDVVAFAKKALKENITAEESIKTIKKDFFAALEDSKIGLELLTTPMWMAAFKLFGNGDMDFKECLEGNRAAWGIFSLGLSELIKVPEATIRYLINMDENNKKIENIVCCIRDLKSEESNNSTAVDIAE